MSTLGQVMGIIIVFTILLLVIAGIGFLIYWLVQPKRNVEVGQICDVDGDCINDACGRETAADNALKICCPSGRSNRFGGFDYCADMPNGSVCWSDAQCAGGFCKGNLGGTQKGICSGDLPENSECDINAECNNDACGRITAAEGAAKVCCPSGEITAFAGFDYCTQMPDDSVCWSDFMCASEFCEGNAGGFQRGICVSRNRPPGDICNVNADCNNDACGRITAAEGAAKVCCPSGQITTFGGFDYCTQMTDGSVCWSDAMCASDFCEGNAGGFQRGVCRSRNRQPGDICNVNADCNNDACGRITAAEGAVKVCCPGGEITTFAGFDYCTQMPPGSVCWSDAMCASDFCRGNASGFQRGICD